MTGKNLVGSKDNLIVDSEFTQGEKYWQIHLPPSTPAWAEFRDGYCHVKGGANVRQNLELKLGKYHFSFEGLFTDVTTSSANLALELSGLRKQIDVKSGSDFTPYEFNFSVDKTVAEGDYDFFSLMLVGNENGGKFRNLKLVLVG